jgi:hypothetical protein
MDAANIQEHPKMIQQAVNSCLEQAKSCALKTVADIVNSCNMYLMKYSNKLI